MISLASLARRTACATLLGLTALLPSTAGAASFDCRAPADAFQRTVCADPALSALEGEVATYRRDMAGIPWRRGLRERHDAAMAALRNDSARDPAAIRRGLQARLAALREENEWFSSHGLEEAPERRLRTTCLALPSSEGAAAQRRRCRVAEFGSLGTVDGRRFAFALYEYPPDPTGDLANETAILVLSAGQPGEWTVDIAERLTEANCMRPRLVRHGQDSLLYLPCAETGTAGGAIPLLYRRAGPASFRIWQEIEAEGWRSTLEQRLPAGLEVRGVVALDPERLTVAFRLWREDDRDCCPTGGRAEARLALEGERLVLRDVALRPGQQNPPQR
ncbi:hypothetical protein GXW74_08295 [Roseomonas eburnea]|uniref:DUF1311 domain-containing protein n=1 Tax=Neoroseomonas eburnea TaxID=1346889 RepID=A0A9X9X9U8_9PROT|nr:hypothetical protein [Neoroseomonas eburnea]MBR0680484.1 hypothetical protein [Neoroseomonas eburnea]